MFHICPVLTKLPTNVSNSVAHFDLEAFFASVEVLRNSALKGKPLIVGGVDNRGLVAVINNFGGLLPDGILLPRGEDGRGGHPCSLRE